MSQQELPPGTILCRNRSKGVRPPITISRIGFLRFLWGRQDAAVYLIAGPPALLLLATAKMWWPLLVRSFGLVIGCSATVLICVGVPALLGMAASRAGVTARSLPRHLAALAARIPLPSSSETGYGAISRERPLKVGGALSRTVVLPDPYAKD
jgi:hypothetical protein